MERLRIITRTGIIDLSGKPSANQCAKVGHELYNYTIRVLFHPSVKLDHQTFIVDHQVIDDAVQQVMTGSCEVMAARILDKVEEALMDTLKLDCMGIKLTIKPVGVDPLNSAYFEEFRVERKEYAKLVMCM